MLLNDIPVCGWFFLKETEMALSLYPEIAEYNYIIRNIKRLFNLPKCNYVIKFNN